LLHGAWSSGWFRCFLRQRDHRGCRLSRAPLRLGVGRLVAIEGRADIAQRAGKGGGCPLLNRTSPRGRAHGRHSNASLPSYPEMDSAPYRLPRMSMGDRLAGPSGKRLFGGDVPKSLLITRAWWPPSAGRIAQEAVLFLPPPLDRSHCQIASLAGGGAVCNGDKQEVPDTLN